MAVVNRCAIGLAPRPPLIAWSRQTKPGEDMAWRQEDYSLYLIPTYEDEEEGMALLQQGYEDIFEAELDSWCRDSASWPPERTFALFLEWFEVRFYPLVEDLVDDELEREEPDGEFIDAMRDALEELNRRS
jgi:hypothetical protein